MFQCKGKGRKAAAHLTANKVQMFIKKKPKRGTKRCLNFGHVDLSTVGVETHVPAPAAQNGQVQSGEKNLATGADTCITLKNQREKSGLYKNGEWDKDGGRQFNSFIYLPFPVKAVTNWRVNVQFSNVVSDIEVWVMVLLFRPIPCLAPNNVKHSGVFRLIPKTKSN